MLILDFNLRYFRTGARCKQDIKKLYTNIGEIHYHNENKTNGCKQIEFSEFISVILSASSSIDSILV